MQLLADDLRSAPATLRPFRPDPFQPDAVRRAAEAARIATWRVVAVTDPALRRAIRDAHLPHWRAHLVGTGGARVIAADAPARRARDLRAADAFATGLHEIPVHVLLLGRRGGTLRPGVLADLRRALHDEQLAAVPVPLVDRAQPELRAALDLPDDLTLEAVLAARPHR
ncbi:MAG TPA: hypothetical protein VFT50_10805 [Baekduia sp.]|nr:hypothetical protein [Baekduia sp.]